MCWVRPPASPLTYCMTPGNRLPWSGAQRPPLSGRSKAAEHQITSSGTLRTTPRASEHSRFLLQLSSVATRTRGSQNDVAHPVSPHSHHPAPRGEEMLRPLVRLQWTGVELAPVLMPVAPFQHGHALAGALDLRETLQCAHWGFRLGARQSIRLQSLEP